MLEKLFKKRVDADYLTERNGKSLDEEYFKKELEDVKNNPPTQIQILNTLITSLTIGSNFIT